MHLGHLLVQGTLGGYIREEAEMSCGQRASKPKRWTRVAKQRIAVGMLRRVRQRV